MGYDDTSLQVNDYVYLQKRGRGFIKQINPHSRDYRYLVKFENGALCWLPVWTDFERG